MRAFSSINHDTRKLKISWGISESGIASSGGFRFRFFLKLLRLHNLPYMGGISQLSRGASSIFSPRICRSCCSTMKTGKWKICTVSRIRLFYLVEWDSAWKAIFQFVNKKTKENKENSLTYTLMHLLSGQSTRFCNKCTKIKDSLDAVVFLLLQVSLSLFVYGGDNIGSFCYL